MLKPIVIAAAAFLARASLAQGGGAEPSAASKGAAKAPAKGAGKDLYALFVTSRGKIGVKLDPSEAPNAVTNFVELAQGKKAWRSPETGAEEKKPLYDGTLFHRVIPRFMIQGGDPLTRGAPLGETSAKNGMTFGTGGPGFDFDDEIVKGSMPYAKPCQLAMANHGPNTNGSQFFITEVPAAHLNPVPCESKTGVCGYVHMGEGVCGCDLVAKIAAEGNSNTRLEKVVVTNQVPTCK